MPAPTTTPIPYTAEELDAVTYDANGLVPAIVQEEGTNEVLMVGWMNREALERIAANRPHMVLEPEPPASTGARARPRATASTCATPATTATWTCCCSWWSRRAGAPATRAQRSCFFRAFGDGSTPGPV